MVDPWSGQWRLTSIPNICRAPSARLRHHGNQSLPSTAALSRDFGSSANSGQDQDAPWLCGNRSAPGRIRFLKVYPPDRLPVSSQPDISIPLPGRHFRPVPRQFLHPFQEGMPGIGVPLFGKILLPLFRDRTGNPCRTFSLKSWFPSESGLGERRRPFKQRHAFDVMGLREHVDRLAAGHNITVASEYADVPRQSRTDHRRHRRF